MLLRSIKGYTTEADGMILLLQTTSALAAVPVLQSLAKALRELAVVVVPTKAP